VEVVRIVDSRTPLRMSAPDTITCALTASPSRVSSELAAKPSIAATV
jgi:hypothetical protein